MVATTSQSGMQHSFMRPLFCAPDLAKQHTSLAPAPSWAALLLQESLLLCEHNLRVLPQTEHPCGHTIGARSVYPSLSTVWFAILGWALCSPFIFMRFALLRRSFQLPILPSSLFSMFSGHCLYLVTHFSAKNFPVAYSVAVVFRCVSQ